MHNPPRRKIEALAQPATQPRSISDWPTDGQTSTSATLLLTHALPHKAHCSTRCGPFRECDPTNPPWTPPPPFPPFTRNPVDPQGIMDEKYGEYSAQAPVSHHACSRVLLSLQSSILLQTPSFSALV